MENVLLKMKEQLDFNSNRYFRCKECRQEFRTYQESKRDVCRDCAFATSVSGIIARCHTCDFPIYRGEAIYRSSKGTYSGTTTTVGGSKDMGEGYTGSASYSKHQGETQSDQ